MTRWLLSYIAGKAVIKAVRIAASSSVEQRIVEAVTSAAEIARRR